MGSILDQQLLTTEDPFPAMQLIPGSDTVLLHLTRTFSTALRHMTVSGVQHRISSAFNARSPVQPCPSPFAATVC